MIRFVNQDGLAVVTIDRPGKANSLTGRMLRDLTATFDQIAAAECRAAVLTGTGTVFSAGADLEEARAGLATSTMQNPTRWHRIPIAFAFGSSY